MSSTARIILTRPVEDAREMAQEWRHDYGWDVHLWPLRVRHRLAFDRAVFEQSDICILSSRAAAVAMGDALNGRKVLVVGGRTADAAAIHGAIVLAQFANVSELIGRLADYPGQIGVAMGEPSSVNWRALATQVDRMIAVTTVYQVSDCAPIPEPSFDFKGSLIFPVFSNLSWPVLGRALARQSILENVIILPFSDEIREFIQADPLMSKIRANQGVQLAKCPSKPNRFALSERIAEILAQ